MAKKLVDLQDFVKEISRLYGDRDVYRYIVGDVVISKTYKQFEHDVNAVASWMLKQGWSGKHIAILGSSSYSWAVTFLAICNSANIAVPIDKMLPKTEILNLLVMGDIDVIFLDEEFEIMMEDIRNADNQITEIISFAGTTYRSILRTEPAPLPAIDPEALTEILFTSGTTGTSRVLCSHKRILLQILMISAEWIIRRI